MGVSVGEGKELEIKWPNKEPEHKIQGSAFLLEQLASVRLDMRSHETHFNQFQKQQHKALPL